MKKILLAVAAAAALAGAASTASAAIMPVTFTTPGADGSFSGTFGDTGITTTTFTDTFTFNLPTGFATTTVTTALQGLSTDVNFTSVTLNGHPFSVGSAGVNEFRFLDNLVVSNGPQTLVLTGTSGTPATGSNGSYAGTIAFAPAVKGVPEPAAWALMIFGFGGVGATLRRRRSRPALAAA